MIVRPLAGVWFGAFAFFLSFFLLLSALPLYARDHGASDTAIGVIMGCFAITAMLFRPWTGWAADRFGRKPLMLAGAALFAVSSLAYGAVTSAAALVAVRLAHGAGMGLYPTAATALVADLAPPLRRGEFLGLFGAAGSLAMAIGPIVGIELTQRLSFDALFLIAAAIGAVALALTAAAPETLTARSPAPFRPGAAFSRAALAPSLVIACLMLTYGAQISFLPLHAHAQGVNPGIFFLVYAATLTAVRHKAGQISDRVGRAPVAAVGLGVAAAALLLLATTRGVTGLAAAGALYGVGHGTAQPALMAWCVDGVEPAQRGRAMGTLYTALELGIMIGAMSAGLAVARLGFAATFVLAAVVAAAGAVVAMASAGRTATVDARSAARPPE